MTEGQDLFELDAQNPLINRLPPERTLLEWADALKFVPRSKSKRSASRIPESHVHVIEAIFVPTLVLVEVVVTLFTMMIVSLRQRDPRLAENRRILFEFAELKRGKLGPDLRDLPWFSSGASGGILMGPTGCAKTHTLRTLFRLLPQVIEHGPSPECGWVFLKQLVYLHVDMPADATRGGLLYAIAMAADKALGTAYAKNLQRRRTIEEKLVDVLHLLMIHRCGMLVLDEVQVRNVAPAVLGPEFVTFFLRVMNCGIPLVLIGNPLSFGHVLNFSQDLRRLTTAGMFDFYPTYDDLDSEWSRQLVPGIWNWTIFDKKNPVIKDLNGLLYERTGGVVDLLVRYRRESIVQALRAGADCVTEKHMNAAFHSPAMRGLHKLISAYVSKDVEGLASFSDQPLAYLEEFWKRMRMTRSDQKKATEKPKAVLAEP